MNKPSYICILGAVALAAYSAKSDSIYQTGPVYTDEAGDQQGSANDLRDLTGATISNDANNLYITIDINPAGNLATGGAFNYIIGITTGSPTAGGDTSANATTHGNAYGRSISFDSGFGGMTDFIGVFGAGGSGSTSSPYTSYGFNDYVFGTPGSTEPAGVWTKIENVASGEPLSDQPSTSIPNVITLTVPLSDFASNLALTPGTAFDFDIDSTGTSGNQTAYDSLATQGVIQSGTYSATYQFNETVFDQYTITAPEPATCALAAMGGLGLFLARRRNQKA